MALLKTASLPGLSLSTKFDDSSHSLRVFLLKSYLGHIKIRFCCDLSPSVGASARASIAFHQGPQVSPFSYIKSLSSGSKAAVLDNTPVQTSQEFKLKKPVVVIDNYDSFTYNLVQYLGSLGCPVEVYRNDELTVEELKMKEPSGILISPGPGTPQESGISLETVVKLGTHIPLFGVCMGLQCMGEAFGGKIVRSPYGVMHGKKSLVYYDEHGEDGLLAGLPNPFVAGRYHSLVIDKENFPSNELEVTAWTEDGLVMGVRHKRYRHMQGVQFHPESIITDGGMNIIENFLNILVQRATKH